MTEQAIALEGVWKRFGRKEAVRNVDLHVPRGTLCGFIGPNGAGKSTTIRMIMSIIMPDEGHVKVLGATALDAKDRIGYLPEERGVYRKMRVLEFLKYIAKLKGMPTGGLDARARAWLERVGLPDTAKLKCEELSKGMSQKVQFVASILHEPELIILDEPFSGLDPVNSRMLNQLIQELHAEGRTILFSTHVMHQAEQLCDRIVLINKGEKLLDATMGEIRARFDPRTVAAEPLHAEPALAERAARIVGVEQATWLPKHRTVQATMTRGSDGQHVMAQLMALAPMRSVELQRTTLDDVFVELVGGDALETTGQESGNG
jgi:ABC-2 type transport system ATP-binding protein